MAEGGAAERNGQLRVRERERESDLGGVINSVSPPPKGGSTLPILHTNRHIPCNPQRTCAVRVTVVGSMPTDASSLCCSEN